MPKTSLQTMAFQLSFKKKTPAKALKPDAIKEELSSNKSHHLKFDLLVSRSISVISKSVNYDFVSSSFTDKSEPHKGHSLEAEGIRELHSKQLF